MKLSEWINKEPEAEQGTVIADDTLCSWEVQAAQLESINAELLARLELASKYVAKMVADGFETVLSPEVALSRITEAIRKAKENNHAYA